MGYGTHQGIVKSIDETWRTVEVTFEPHVNTSAYPGEEQWPLSRAITESFLANVEVGDFVEYDVSYDTSPYMLIGFKTEASPRFLLDRIRRIEKHLGLSWPE